MKKLFVTAFLIINIFVVYAQTSDDISKEVVVDTVRSKNDTIRGRSFVRQIDTTLSKTGNIYGNVKDKETG
jgi:hypothetical protein